MDLVAESRAAVTALLGKNLVFNAKP